MLTFSPNLRDTDCQKQYTLDHICYNTWFLQLYVHHNLFLKPYDRVCDNLNNDSCENYSLSILSICLNDSVDNSDWIDTWLCNNFHFPHDWNS